MMKQNPTLIPGGIAVDNRGQLTFANEFDFRDVKRFYLIQNHHERFVRAWHGHKIEGKYFTVLSGAALVCGVEIDDWIHPSKDLEVYRYVLSAQSPSILFIPPGFANGHMSLTKETRIMVYSTSSLQESLGDDFRFDSRHWDPWVVEER
jgi:dTDP-4-dehydrorhamnose 3,5-epimerase-like enzyme